MISVEELRQIASARLRDSEVLCRADRYNGAIYLCGYAVEIALKAKICETIRWSSFPKSKKEFENYQSFKTHKLDVLLSLSGVEREIKENQLAEWSAVATWEPEVRYNPVGGVDKEQVELMIEAAGIPLEVL